MTIANESQARQRVIELVKHVKAKLAIPSYAVYKGINDPIAEYLGIKIKESTLPNNADGQYYPLNPPLLTSPMVILNPQIGEQDRLNFTFFHEICHHLIRQDDELYSFLNEFASDLSLINTIEKYCNIGAAEFLIPGEDVRAEIDRAGFQITLLEHFDQKFPASKPAIAIQLANYASHKCFVTVSAMGNPPKSNDDFPTFVTADSPDQRRLYIQYSVSSPSNKYTIARYIPIPRDHLITQAFETQSRTRGKAIIPLRNQKAWESDCDAFFYKGRVYASFNISPPAIAAQLQPHLFD